MRIHLIALPLLLSSCIITGGTDPDPCEDILLEPAPPSIEYRDPVSGTCSFLGGGGGGGGGGGSGGTCGDFGGGGTGGSGGIDPSGGDDSGNSEEDPNPQRPGAFPDWAVCYQGCEGLDEQTCQTTYACRAAYVIEPGGSQSFYECWGTAQSGPIQGGDCELLDAYACSLHDDCSPVHSTLESPSGSGGLTIALGPFQNCIAEPGDVPDPGECTGEVLCDIIEPNCPANTTPGIKDGCYTGYCIPLDECAALANCSTLAEDSCVARSDCEGLYQGVDCVCEGDVCSCASWLFEGCDASGP